MRARASPAGRGGRGIAHLLELVLVCGLRVCEWPIIVAGVSYEFTVPVLLLALNLPLWPLGPRERRKSQIARHNKLGT